VCVGLFLCQKLKDKALLREEDLDTGGGQVPGLSGETIKRILERHGITHKYSAEGGRTSRSSVPLARSIAEFVNANEGFQALPDAARLQVVATLEDRLIHEVQRYFDRKRIEVSIDMSKPGPAIVSDILSVARSRGLGGAVAQHLVGAKLARRFADREISNNPATAADAQTGREADFSIGRTVFHVTVAPMPPVVERCAANIRQGFRPYLIVPYDTLERARAYALSSELQDSIALVSIEQFVGQNLDEMAAFDPNNTAQELAAVLHEYNRRVAEAETDQSLQIVIPANVDPNQ